MRKANNTTQKRSFRRWVRQLLSSLTKCRPGNDLEDIRKVIDMLQEIQESIDIIAREIARQAKRGE